MNVMVNPEAIRGSGGGSSGKSSKSGSSAANSLHSRATARIVELLGEGPIGGLVNGEKSIYFDKTVYANDDGTYNFSGVTWEERKGYPDQEHLAGFTQAEQVVTVEQRVRHGAGPVTRTIVSPDADAVRVIMKLPALYSVDSAGMQTASVSYTIQTRPAGGTWADVVQNNITDQKTSSLWEIAHRISKPSGATGDWDVRVVRNTSDSSDDNLQNETWWESYATITEGKFTYPHCAIVALTVDAEDFGSSIPTRTYIVDGLIIDVPSNYDPIARTYTGIWDGTFKQATTDNPAWILRDIVINDRYGLGDVVSSSYVDKWKLYQIAQYCDRSLSDSADGTIPAFTYNGVISNAKEAAKVLESITAVFNGMSFWSAGQVFATADMPSDPVRLVTNANVVDGSFSYSTTSLKGRPTVAIMKWNDKDDLFAAATEVVVDEDAVARYGWREKSVQLEGCKYRAQAYRAGKWALDVDTRSFETVEYKSSWDHLDALPGDIVQIADSSRAQVRTAGKLVSVSGDNKTYVLDAPFDRVTGSSYVFQVTLPDGTIHSASVASWSDDNTTLTIASAPAQAPIVNAVWMLKGDVEPTQWRVLVVRETEPHIFTITALFHDPTKYARVEEGVSLVVPTYTRVTDTVEPPSAIDVVKSYVYENGVASIDLNVSWSQPLTSYARGFYVVADTPKGRVTLGELSTRSTTFSSVTNGTWTISVWAISGTGKKSVTPATVTIEVGGYTDLPAPTITNLALSNGTSANTFASLDAVIGWTNVFSGSVTTSSGNTLYRDNVVVVKDAADGAILHTESVVGESYTYGYSTNVADAKKLAKAPVRSLTFEVVVRDVFDRSSDAVTLTASNPVPAAIAPTLSSTSGTLFVEWDAPSDIDFAGVQAWIGTSATFTPDDTNLAYDGSGSMFSVAKAEGSYWVIIAPYDGFGKTGLNKSSATKIDVASITSVIADASITTAKFAAGIQPITLVTALPAVDGYTGTKLVLLESDNKVYRFTGSAWETNVPASDITGQITASQIAADTITSGQIAAGAISASELAVGSVRAQHLLIAPKSLNLDPSFEGGATTWGGFVRRLSYSDSAVPTGCPVQYASQFDARDNMSNAYIDVVPGETYKASCWVNASKCTALAGGIGTVGLLYNAAGTIISTHIWSRNLTDTTNWVNVSGNFLIPSGGARLRFGVWADRNSYHGEAWYADLTVEKVNDASLIVDGTITATKIAANAITSDKIVADAITSDKIAANAITASEIASGAVTTDKLAAGSVTTDKLTVGGQGNLLYGADGMMAPSKYLALSWNPDNISGYETGKSHELVGSYDWTIADNTTVAIAQTNGNSGSTGISDFKFMKPNSSGALDVAKYPVTPGVNYEFSMYIGVHRCNCSIGIYFVNVNNIGIQFIQSTDATKVGGKTLDLYSRLYVRGLAPVNAAYAVLIIRKGHTTQEMGYLDSYVFFVRPQFKETTSNASDPSAWTSPGLTTIDGSMIATGTLTADRIVAGTITADKLVLGGVTTDRIADSAVTDIVSATANGWSSLSISIVSSGYPIIIIGSAFKNLYNPANSGTLYDAITASYSYSGGSGTISTISGTASAKAYVPMSNSIAYKLAGVPAGVTVTVSVADENGSAMGNATLIAMNVKK